MWYTMNSTGCIGAQCSIMLFVRLLDVCYVWKCQLCHLGRVIDSLNFRALQNSKWKEASFQFKFLKEKKKCTIIRSVRVWYSQHYTYEWKPFTYLIYQDTTHTSNRATGKVVWKEEYTLAVVINSLDRYRDESTSGYFIFALKMY